MLSDHNELDEEYDDDEDLDDYQPTFLVKAALIIALFSPFILFGVYGLLK